MPNLTVRDLLAAVQGMDPDAPVQIRVVYGFCRPEVAVEVRAEWMHAYRDVRDKPNHVLTVGATVGGRA